MDLHEKLFSEIPEVRYVAVSDGQSLSLHQRNTIENSSETVSDRFEELLVNPAVLLLTKQRGEIDCDGLKYVLIRIVPLSNGG